jgi:1-acyl-sn-glycerol-3-phosphate acyltransferase
MSERGSWRLVSSEQEAEAVLSEAAGFPVLHGPDSGSGSDARHPQHLAKFHAIVRAGESGWAYDLTWWIVVRPMLALYRVRALEANHVPATGPVILAPNHASFLDHFLLAGIAGRRLSFMAKSQMFRWPLSLASRLGAFPVRRGRRDEEAFTTAHAVLERSGCLVLYCEGGMSRDGRIRERAKPGIGRLALESGAPIVPVALLDTLQIQRKRLPRVTVRFGAPLRFGRHVSPPREQQQEVADAVLAEIKRLHEVLMSAGHAGARRSMETTGALFPGHRR